MAMSAGIVIYDGVPWSILLLCNLICVIISLYPAILDPAILPNRNIYRMKPYQTYPGGKGGSGVYQNIINEIPPHNRLIIPFLGNCAIIRNIRRAKDTIGIDINPEVISAWKSSNIKRISLLNRCGIEYLESLSGVDQGETVIYLDPPYPLPTRKRSTRNIYKYEMSLDGHKRLLEAIKQVKAYILISTYKNDLYKKALGEWRVKTFQAQTRGKPAIEYLYMNYSIPRRLHDYRYLGDDFRDRERIKRKINRWVNNLEKLPALERSAIIEAIEKRKL